MDYWVGVTRNSCSLFGFSNNLCAEATRYILTPNASFPHRRL